MMEVGWLDYPEPEHQLRGALIVSQVLGVLIARYVLWVAPTLQRYLTGVVDGEDSPSTTPAR